MAKAQINAYLMFAGNCREAITFYHQCLGGELELKTFKESPLVDDTPEAEHNNVVHSKIENNDIVLMASDGLKKDELIMGNTVALSLNCTSDEEIDNYFESLSAGAQIIFPLEKQFWGAKFGMLKDKFGIKWMFNYHPEENQ